jgi:hypothetical protein
MGDAAATATHWPNRLSNLSKAKARHCCFCWLIKKITKTKAKQAVRAEQITSEFPPIPHRRLQPENYQFAPLLLVSLDNSRPLVSIYSGWF